MAAEPSSRRSSGQGRGQSSPRRPQTEAGSSASREHRGGPWAQGPGGGSCYLISSSGAFCFRRSPALGFALRPAGLHLRRKRED